MVLQEGQTLDSKVLTAISVGSMLGRDLVRETIINRGSIFSRDSFKIGSSMLAEGLQQGDRGMSSRVRLVPRYLQL